MSNKSTWECFLAELEAKTMKYPQVPNDFSSNQTIMAIMGMAIMPADWLSLLFLVSVHWHCWWCNIVWLWCGKKFIVCSLIFIGCIIMSPPPLWRGGTSWFTWFPVTQCVSASVCPSRPSVQDFVYGIFPTVFHQWLSHFQIWWPWTRPWID